MEAAEGDRLEKSAEISISKKKLPHFQKFFICEIEMKNSTSTKPLFFRFPTILQILLVFVASLKKPPQTLQEIVFLLIWEQIIFAKKKQLHLFKIKIYFNNHNEYFTKFYWKRAQTSRKPMDMLTRIKL